MAFLAAPPRIESDLSDLFANVRLVLDKNHFSRCSCKQARKLRRSGRKLPRYLTSGYISGASKLLYEAKIIAARFETTERETRLLRYGSINYPATGYYQNGLISARAVSRPEDD